MIRRVDAEGWRGQFAVGAGAADGVEDGRWGRGQGGRRR